MTEQNESEPGIVAVDTDDDAETLLAADEVDQDDPQEVLIDNVIAQDEPDPEPAGDETDDQ